MTKAFRSLDSQLSDSLPTGNSSYSALAVLSFGWKPWVTSDCPCAGQVSEAVQRPGPAGWCSVAGEGSHQQPGSMSRGHLLQSWCLGLLGPLLTFLRQLSQWCWDQAVLQGLAQAHIAVLRKLWYWCSLANLTQTLKDSRVPALRL